MDEATDTVDPLAGDAAPVAVIPEGDFPKVSFFPLDPTLPAEFWPRTNALREQCPVGFSDQPWSAWGAGFWLLNSYKEVLAAGADWKTFSNADGATPVQFDLNVMRMVPLETDPPMHRGIRRQLNPFFTPERLASQEDSIQELVDRLLAKCIAQSPVDLTKNFVNQIPPVIFFVNFLGQEEGTIDWIMDILGVLLTAPERAFEVLPELFMWEADLLEERRAAGKDDDLAGVIAHLGMKDGDALELDELDRIQTLNLMIMAGMETTMGALGNICALLAQDNALRLTLRDLAGPALDQAIEELLRHESPVPTAGRTIGQDAEIGGCPMKKGDRALLNWAAANRDPAQFPDPDAIVLDRENSASHVAFGAGIHRCLGNHLARREIKAAVKALCALKTFDLVEGETVTYRAAFARGPISLPMVLEA